MKSVKDFKKLRHTLYKWSQVVQISNQLTLIFSAFFLILSIIETSIDSPPFLTTVAALSLTTKDLYPNSPDNHNLPLNNGSIYALQLANSAIMLILAFVGVYVRSRLHLEAANIQMKILVVVPFLVVFLMIGNAVLSYKYLHEVYA